MVSDNNITLAQAVINWRLQHGYSISEAARKSDIPYPTFRRIEHGSEPRSATLEKLAKVLLMAPDEVYSRFILNNGSNKKDQ